MPTTIEGVWVITSTKRRTIPPSRCFPYSER